jgi:hypothetical protein
VRACVRVRARVCVYSAVPRLSQLILQDLVLLCNHCDKYDDSVIMLD